MCGMLFVMYWRMLSGVLANVERVLYEVSILLAFVGFNSDDPERHSFLSVWPEMLFFKMYIVSTNPNGPLSTVLQFHFRQGSWHSYYVCDVESNPLPSEAHLTIGANVRVPNRKTQHQTNNSLTYTKNYTNINSSHYKRHYKRHISHHPGHIKHQIYSFVLIEN